MTTRAAEIVRQGLRELAQAEGASVGQVLSWAGAEEGADLITAGGASFPPEWVVTDAGSLEIRGADVANGQTIFSVEGNLDAQVLAVYKDFVTGTGLVNITEVEGRVRFWNSFADDDDPVLEITSGGDVAIAGALAFALTDDATVLTIFQAAGATAQALLIKDGDGDTYMFAQPDAIRLGGSDALSGEVQVDSTGVKVWGDASNDSNPVIRSATGEKIGFFGATPVTQQTGVAVNAAGIHAALVNLGLITA